jgi:ribonuclease-3
MGRPGDPDEDDASALERRLGYRFRRPELLRTALTHRSRSHEEAGAASDYERLELLGDALLGFVVSDWLYREDELASEGVLTRRRQAIVRASTLAEAARRIGLGELVRLGRGEVLTGGRNKPSLLADVFEAVLAAVYIDGGLRPARTFVRRHLGLSERRAFALDTDDFKTRLQETIQASLQRTPNYRIVSTKGPPHAREFEAEVVLDGDVLGRGSGTTRKQAEQEAARRALERWPGEEPLG